MNEKKEKNMKDFMIGFLLALVVLLGKQVINGNKYDTMERYLLDHYYSKNVLEEAIRNQLEGECEESDSSATFLYENFDNYVYSLVLNDINKYENEKLAKYNAYCKQEEAIQVINIIEKKEPLKVEEKDNTCYIAIPGFVKDYTYKEFIKYKDIYDNNTKFIIDLRNNSGGDIDELIDILSVFYENDEVIYTYIKNDKITEEKAKSKEKITFDKIVFLCNEKTASASEVMINNMKTDFPERIITIGSKTYGKNFCYSLKRFKDGELFMFVSALMGNSKGVTFDENGIKPDYSIEGDNCLDKAIELLQ